ncbi:uncharacterized protein C8A04DRAFT_9831 [Dichotomopilus funicola]|uniref:PHD and RING finger domain-containing protein n=1 Tax=Dichotomopilus funicola TaxID=1934379 RepID=A0AAN6ZQ80_9PEZI|nr:hypothetical protein C8A04DRAFT_9831 [Dichotomopilus funicola]
MADQCIVCLEPLDVEASALPTPLAPAEQQQQQQQQHPEHQQQQEQQPQQPPQSPTVKHEHLAIADAETLAGKQALGDANNGLVHGDNHEDVAKIDVCGHMLHDSCLREWTEKANSCPICRQAFHNVTVYDKIGGKTLSTRKVEDKRQAPVVPEYDPREWMEEFTEQADVPGRRCPVCNSSGDEETLLLCDGCDAAYHTYCVELDEVPRGPWFCMECEHALGPDIMQPVDNVPSRDGGFMSRGYYFPRTQASMRRARQRARSDEWQGAWGRITGRVWDALELDLDYQDEEDSAVFEGLQRSRQLRERERDEHQRWQQRLNIAARLGARDVFLNNIPRWVNQQQPQPNPPSREERLAWGALEKAREMESRKRKSRSATAEPSEEPHHEPERKLKRPRTRRLLPQNGESSSSAARDSALSSSTSTSRQQQQQPHPHHQQQQNQHQPQNGSSSRTAEAPPSFLSSLLKEVEMSTPSDEDSLVQMFGPIPGVNDAPSPAHSHGSTTPPPPNRATSPVMTLSSHIAPIYASPSYTPTRGLSLDTAEESRSSSPQRGRPRGPSRDTAQSSPDNSDSEHHHRGRRQRPQQQQRPRPSAASAAATAAINRHGPLEIRQPQPQRAPGGILSSSTSRSRSRPQSTSPTRNHANPNPNPNPHPHPHPHSHALPLEMKESISKIVRGALKPHWHSKQLTAEQYETINRDISRKIYEEVKAREPARNDAVGEAVDENVQKGWERLATREVARAVASLKA